MGNNMTEEQKLLFDKLTPLQQKVAINVISGMSDIDSYESAGGKGKNKETSRSSVSRMLTDVNVKEFIDLMKGEAVKSAVMSRAEMLERLSNLSRVNMSDLVEWDVAMTKDVNGEIVEQSVWKVKPSAEQDPIAMSSISELTSGAGGIKIKQHSPLAAMKQLADMEGYNKPVKTEISGSIATVELSKEEYADTRRKMLAEDDC